MSPSVPAGAVRLGWPRRPLIALLAAFVLGPAWLVLQGSVARLPPTMLLLVVVGPGATLLIGVLAGNVALGLALATVAGFWATHTPANAAENALLSNLIGVLITSQLFVYGYTSTFGRLRLRIAEHRARIEQRLLERERLTTAVSADLNGAVAEVGSALSAAQPALAALVTAQRELERVMDHARQTLHFRKEPDLEAPDVLPDFRLRVTRWLLAVSLFNISLLLLRLALTGRGPWLITCTMFLINASVWIGMELRPAPASSS